MYNYKKKLREIINYSKEILVSPEKRFHEIYMNNLWGDVESISGPGSRIDATEILRDELQVLLKKFNIKSLVDAPCGDFNWMKLINLQGIVYSGIDIVENIIYLNNKKYSSNNIKFICKNFINEVVPNADLIICRDCLPHFSNINVKKALKNFLNSKSKYLLMSSYPKCLINTDIITGEWRKINFSLEPYNFPSPIYIINERSPLNLENGQNYDKCLFLYNLTDLKNYILK